jgi:hypothetical protein
MMVLKKNSSLSILRQPPSLSVLNISDMEEGVGGRCNFPSKMKVGSPPRDILAIPK